LSLLNKIKEGIREASRILKIAKKPDISEVKEGIKISSIIILLVGMLGFLIHLFFILLMK